MVPCAGSMRIALSAKRGSDSICGWRWRFRSDGNVRRARQTLPVERLSLDSAIRPGEGCAFRHSVGAGAEDREPDPTLMKTRRKPPWWRGQSFRVASGRNCCHAILSKLEDLAQARKNTRRRHLSPSAVGHAHDFQISAAGHGKASPPGGGCGEDERESKQL
jgi:hypothetical protein